jgi:uncharacterized SAM-binding protein YcdF (DUF218 family)
MNTPRKLPISFVDLKRFFIPCVIVAVISLSIRISLPALEDYLVVDRPLQHADALVLMAGEVPIRLPAAARLYKEGKADKILLTNDGVLGAWSEQKQRNLYQVEWAEDELLKMGIPESAIVILTYSASGSIFDAINTKKYVSGSGIRNLLVVTSDYHTRRSLWAFQTVFRGYPITIGVTPAKEISTMSHLKKFLILAFEMVKFIYYRLAYNNF